MVRIVLVLAALGAAFTLSAPPVAAQTAACYADYKAKRGRPLELHYGVVALRGRACERPQAAERQIARRIAVDGWELLAVQSVFGEEALGEKEGDAGRYFLRY